jgi:hypothetical protein
MPARSNVAERAFNIMDPSPSESQGQSADHTLGWTNDEELVID